MMEFSKSQMIMFEDRYKFQNEQSPVDMWRRVARWGASNENDNDYWYQKFFSLLYGFKFIPGGRINHAAGREGVTAHNCFVIPSPEDSIDGIFHSLRQWAETMRRGGGVGINMSTLRPRGSEVKGVGGTSSGPIPWMVPFTTMSKEVIQQGGTRRGAAMIILNVEHPDVLEFIRAKERPGYLEGANLSVGISNAFMEAVKNKEPWFFSDGTTMGASALWQEIAMSAWRSGEPGIVFLERCNDESNLRYLGDKYKIVCVNPCSEIPLAEYGACLLGTMNASAYVNDDGQFAWISFQMGVKDAVRLLDNVIDLSLYPLPEYEAHQKAIRQIGLGITGLADAMIKMGIAYNSSEAVVFTDNLYKGLAYAAYSASIGLAGEKGMFPECIPEEHANSPFVKKLPMEFQLGVEANGIRNSYLIAQQPSGTGSNLAGVSSGIEPIFSFDAVRVDRTGVWNPVTGANGKGIDERVKVSAHDLSPEEHINIQAVAQNWCDQAISKTINMPEGSYVEDVVDAYNMAWDMGLKSIAVYRNNSRAKQVLFDKDNMNEDILKASIEDMTPTGGVAEVEEVYCRSGSCDV